MCKKNCWCVHVGGRPVLLVTEVPECKEISLDDIRRSGLTVIDWRHDITMLTPDSSAILLQELQRPDTSCTRVTYQRLRELVENVVTRIAARQRSGYR